MSRRIATTLAALALASAACGAPPGQPGTTTVVKSTTSATARLVKVPDVSGMNHQDAQDAMQRAGLYNLREVDGTGQGRALVIDRNWVQTGQDPAPGTEVPADAVITLTAVKYTDR
ncbi:beta-lactam-binding protein with PASTA domain [Amycolatopsis lexingtonensis]|uniref:Beta-lactam-binding protein with PASTA domain n=1 Tax=Amycolatopsis lexingtonensis TaxID=218822 RepID=A0ABR9I0F1_9PSEU|nr:PASTA domain-containing protein [Amycolatopsis lexingtonensis]MBE1496681.1 beta-lactam-binding protein with PASTA domain [Amycolatopsis lexingtonensis]